MKPTNLAILLTTLAEPASSRRVFRPQTDIVARIAELMPGADSQAPLVHPIMPSPPQKAQPAAAANDEVGAGISTGTVLLSDMISIDRRINIFASLVRDIESVSLRLDDGKVNTTVLAPLNSAIESLPRKPWEDPEHYKGRPGEEAAFEGEDGQERANRNLKRFVDAHIVTVSPWKEGDRVETLGGSEVWWEEKEGSRWLMPGRIEVQAVGRAVGNGEVVSLNPPSFVPSVGFLITGRADKSVSFSGFLPRLGIMPRCSPKTGGGPFRHSLVRK